MKEYQINVYNVKTSQIIDTFIAEFTSIDELNEFMENDLHEYDEQYLNISYDFNLL